MLYSSLGETSSQSDVVGSDSVGNQKKEMIAKAIRSIIEIYETTDQHTICQKFKKLNNSIIWWSHNLPFLFCSVALADMLYWVILVWSPWTLLLLRWIGHSSLMYQFIGLEIPFPIQWFKQRDWSNWTNPICRKGPSWWWGEFGTEFPVILR